MRPKKWGKAEEEQKSRRVKESRNLGHETHSNGASGPEVLKSSPVVVFYCQILSRLPSAHTLSGCLGILQCDIQSDIHQALLPAPLWADEIRVVSVETSSSTVAGTRDTSPRKHSPSVRSLLGGLTGCQAPGLQGSDSSFAFHVSPALCLLLLKMVRCRGARRQPLLCSLRAKFTCHIRTSVGPHQLFSPSAALLDTL